MPITVRCHACDARTVIPDKAAGRRVKCPRCNEELGVPAQPSADWQTAPPPVRRPAPAIAPPSDDADPPLEEPAPEPASTDEEGDYELEPWYYHFIERAVINGMWVSIILCILLFVGFTVFCLVMGAGMTATSNSAFGTLSGGCALLILWVCAAIGGCFQIMAIIYGCSWLLLALDAARNLRRIRIKLPGS